MSGLALSDDGTVKPGSALARWWGIFMKVGDIIGKDFKGCEVARESIEAAGFVDVRERAIKLPIGTWPKDKKLKQWGAWNRMFLMEGLEGFAIKGLVSVLQVSGWETGIEQEGNPNVY